jgi:hypothetical protein
LRAAVAKAGRNHPSSDPRHCDQRKWRLAAAAAQAHAERAGGVQR